MVDFNDYTGVITDEVRRRFLSRERIKAGECEEWAGAWSFGISYRSHKPHRVAYAIFHSVLIPDGMSVHRNCSNLKCVNPDHLFVGPKALPVEMRLDRYIDKTPGHGPKGDCHIWTGYLTPSGYGSFSLPDGRTAITHRVVYEIHHGPIPPEFFVLHRCDNRCCCNPNHLYAGSHLQNMADREERNSGYHMKGTDHPRARLTDDDVRAIRADTRVHTSIADDYKVVRSLVSLIKRRKRWAHVS